MPRKTFYSAHEAFSEQDLPPSGLDRMDGGEGQPLTRVLVPASRSSLAAIAVFSGAIALAWVWFGTVALFASALSAWIIFPLSMILAAISISVCVWATRRRLNDEPALIVDEVGIFDNVSIARAGRVKWRDMDKAWLAGPKWMQLICILPDETPEYLASQREIPGALMRLNKGLTAAPIVIPMAVLEWNQDRVWQHIIAIADQSRQSRAPSNLATGI